jgi:hypothetical protein
MMNRVTRRFFWISAYAIAMALLEAVVVAYIRALADVTADRVSLGPYLQMELWREVATIVMLIAVGWIAGHHSLERLAYGMFAFGLWDIAYYGWLRVLIDWPQTLLDWDILFLIPLRWWGPVLSPMLIAGLICTTAVLAVMQMERGRRPRITHARVGIALSGTVLALVVFMSDALRALVAGRPDWNEIRPGPFGWPMFLVALALMALPSLAATWPVRSLPSHGHQVAGFVPAQPPPEDAPRH